MIVDRILAYLEGAGVPVTDDTLNMATRRVARTIKRNLGEQRDRRRRKTIGGSLSWFCPRRAYYSLTGAYAEAAKGRSRVAFLMGDVLQACIDVLATQAGVEFAYPDADGNELELEVTIGGVVCRGHIDHGVRTSRDGIVVMDSKSMATYTYRDFERACRTPSYDPHDWKDWRVVERWGYMAQLRFYMYAVELLDLGTGARGAFIGIDKNTGHLAELWVERDQATVDMFNRAVPALDAMVRRYDDAVAAVRETALANGADDDEADAAASAVPRTVETGLPDRPTWANAVLMPGANKRADGSKGAVYEVDTDKERTGGQGWRCNYCPFAASCWPGFEVVPMSGGPKWRKAAD